MSESQDTNSETFQSLPSDRFCAKSRCPAIALVVMYVLDGEVYLCGHHARSMWPLKFPAFWIGTDDVVFDRDTFWEPPRRPEPVVEEPVVEEEDDEDDEDYEEEDEDD